MGLDAEADRGSDATTDAGGASGTVAGTGYGGGLAADAGCRGVTTAEAGVGGGRAANAGGGGGRAAKAGGGLGATPDDLQFLGAATRGEPADAADAVDTALTGSLTGAFPRPRPGDRSALVLSLP